MGFLAKVNPTREINIVMAFVYGVLLYYFALTIFRGFFKVVSDGRFPLENLFLLGRGCGFLCER